MIKVRDVWHELWGTWFYSTHSIANAFFMHAGVSFDFPLLPYHGEAPTTPVGVFAPV
jgi:hypothetical protein